MKSIIEKIVKERALNGYCLYLENGESFFVTDAELGQHKLVVGSGVTYSFDLTKGMQYLYISGHILQRDSAHPFSTFEEKIAYSRLPEILRHWVNALKLQNPEVPTEQQRAWVYLAALGYCLYRTFPGHLEFIAWRKLSIAEKQESFPLSLVTSGDIANPWLKDYTEKIFDIAQALRVDEKLLRAKILYRSDLFSSAVFTYLGNDDSFEALDIVRYCQIAF